MIAGEIKGKTHNFGKPSDWDESKGECISLAVRGSEIGGLVMLQSIWYPSPQEIELLTQGYPVTLSVIGQGHPPVSMQVNDEDGEPTK